MIILLITLILIIQPVFAFDLDTSVDEEIRRNYNPSALEKSLPALPKTAPTVSVPTQKPKQITPKQTIAPTQTLIDKSTAIRIKKGTKLKAKSSIYLSDSSPEGTKINFTTISPVYLRYITIPAGTVITATVVNSHSPQISGNGGLLQIIIDSLTLNGKRYYANGKITKVNNKKVFINNIKGKRKYIANMGKQIDKGENFYKKTRRVSNKLADNPVGIIISPIPVLVGMGAYAVNFASSPIISIGAKGGKISIPAGSKFEIKLLEDIYIQ